MISNAVYVFGSDASVVTILTVFAVLFLAAIIAFALIYARVRRLKQFNPAEPLAEVAEGVESVEEPVAANCEAETVVGYAEDANEDSLDEEAVPAEDLESYRAGKLTYDKSFLAKYIQCDDTVKEWYGKIKNELMSYDHMHERLSWRRETYKVGKNMAAKIAVKGRTLCLYLPLNPKDYENTDYKVDDVSGTTAFADTPLMYRIRSGQRLEYALELIEDVMRRIGVEKEEIIERDYYLPYETLASLIEKGLVKRVMRN